MKKQDAQESARRMSTNGMNATVVYDTWGEFDVLLWDAKRVSEIELDTRLRNMIVVNNYENGKALIA